MNDLDPETTALLEAIEAEWDAATLAYGFTVRRQRARPVEGPLVWSPVVLHVVDPMLRRHALVALDSAAVDAGLDWTPGLVWFSPEDTPEYATACWSTDTALDATHDVGRRTVLLHVDTELRDLERLVRREVDALRTS